jgi:predicted nuclease with TOPRIM domain
MITNSRMRKEIARIEKTTAENAELKSKLKVLELENKELNIKLKAIEDKTATYDGDISKLKDDISKLDTTKEIK